MSDGIEESGNWNPNQVDPTKIKVLPRQKRTRAGSMNFGKKHQPRIGVARTTTQAVNSFGNVISRGHEGVTKRSTETRALNNIQKDQ